MVGFALSVANAQSVMHDEQQTTTTEVKSDKPSHAERKAHERTIKSEAKEEIVKGRNQPNTTINTEFKTRNVSEFHMGHRPHFNITFHNRDYYINHGYRIVIINDCPYFFDTEVNGWVPAFGLSECSYPDNYIVYYD